MEILKEYSTYRNSYVIVQKGDKKFKIERCGSDDWTPSWSITVSLIRDLWFNKTLFYHAYGKYNNADSRSTKDYCSLIKEFDKNDQFK